MGEGAWTVTVTARTSPAATEPRLQGKAVQPPAAETKVAPVGKVMSSVTPATAVRRRLSTAIR